MSRTTKRRILGLSMFGVLFSVIALLALSGCYIDDGYPDGYYVEGDYLADLQVDWTIQGADSAGLCNAYGINRWLVEAHGPEPRTVELNCATYYWSTENDLTAMAEGNYSVTVRAIDHLGHQLAAQSSSVGLYDSGFLHKLHFDFIPADFGF